MIFDRNRRRSADQPAGTALSSTSKQILHRSQHHQTEEDTALGLCVLETQHRTDDLRHLPLPTFPNKMKHTKDRPREAHVWCGIGRDSHRFPSSLCLCSTRTNRRDGRRQCFFEFHHARSAHGQTMSPDDDNDDGGFGYEKFVECIKKIVAISDGIRDGWQLQTKEGWDNGHFITKKVSQILEKSSGEGTKSIVVFEYHIAYNINYGVPVLCFVAWKQDGSSLQMEEYCEYNENFSNSDVLSTLTQLDHPVLCRPFLTLHPCRTREIMDVFLSKSKNPVISWLSVISPFINLKLEDEYIKAC
ncbi:unnamed protein product [Tenebrio molitor]|nr:unnamed protein product [Tenebrio molitor]